MLLPFGRDLNPERWIFVVGCYNSGTSLLSQILAQHPLVGGLTDEGIFFTDSLPYPEQFGWPRMWIRCLDKVRLELDQTSLERAHRIKRQWSLMLPRNAPNLVEKSVVNAVQMPFFQAYFKPAYFIAIVRNGYAVAEGIRRRADPRRWKNPEFDKAYPLALCAEQWRTCGEIISRDSGQLDFFRQIRYEDLTTNPQGTLRDITDFLGLPPLDSAVLNQRWNIREKNEPVKNMNEHSFARLSEVDLDIVEQVAGDLLLKYGYQRPRAIRSTL